MKKKKHISIRSDKLVSYGTCKPLIKDEVIINEKNKYISTRSDKLVSYGACRHLSKDKE